MNPGTQQSVPSTRDYLGTWIWHRFRTPAGDLKEADITAVQWETKGWTDLGPCQPNVAPDPVVGRDYCSPVSVRRIDGDAVPQLNVEPGGRRRV